MIRTKHLTDTTVRVTFSVEDEGHHVTVIGCFNDWDPTAHPLRRRSNGTRSVSVDLPAGSTVRFRYTIDTETGTDYVDDPEADHVEPNGLGQTHSVMVVPVQA